jgi:hypothetical protein
MPSWNLNCCTPELLLLLLPLLLGYFRICRCSTGEYEPDTWLDGERSRDFTDALRPYEQPTKPSWAGVKR